MAFGLLFALILGVIIGIIAGTFSGLFPGIHINLISAILISYIAAGKLDFIPSLGVLGFLVSMGITHTFIDFIPSIYLGAPSDDSFLAVLPGHELLKKGRGHEAVVLTLYGSLAAIPVIVVFTFAFIKIIPIFYNPLNEAIPYILIFASVYLIFREKDWLNAVVIFALSGFLGYLTLNLPVEQPFLPLLGGLFGASTLVISVKEKVKIPEQKITPLSRIKPSFYELVGSVFGAILSAPLMSFLPGMGSGRAAVISSELVPQGRRGFLILVGAINTIMMGLSFATLYVVGKTRTGMAVAIQDVLPNLSFENLMVIIGVVIFAGIVDFVVGIYCSKIIARYITKIKYEIISIVIIIILFVIVVVFSNWLGVLVFVIATALGVFTILSGVRRINLMGCLLVPTILFYLLG